MGHFIKNSKMWGFAQLTKNLVTQASRASCNLTKKASYTPIQKVWANM